MNDGDVSNETPFPNDSDRSQDHAAQIFSQKRLNINNINTFITLAIAKPTTYSDD